MAKILSKTGITTTSTVQAGHVSQSIDAFAGIKAYDISLSGSFHMTGSITGQPGVINNLTASYAMSASVEITKEVSSSFADLAAGLTLTPTISVANIVASGSGGVAIIVSGSIIPEGSGSHNLGSLTNPFKELFITDNSLILVSSSINASGAQQTTGSLSVTLDSEGVLALDGVYTGSFEGKFKGVGDLITSLKGVNPLQVTGSNAFSILSGITTIGGDSSAANPGEGETTIKGAALAITSTATTITSALNINNAPVTNLTASGNISSSGTIIANAFTGPLTGTATGLAGSPDITIDDLTLGSGTHKIDSHGSGVLTIRSGSTTLMQFAADGATTIIYNVTASGDISSSGDIFANQFIGNGSNLTGLPAQTANDFTNTLKSKLDDIEASADVTDTTNVKAALGNSLGTFTMGDVNDQIQISGRSMLGGPFIAEPQARVEINGDLRVSSHITASGNISSSGDIIATGDVIAARFVGNGGNLSGLPAQTANDFTNTLKSKLDGIEAGADHVDTANVTAAGALMDSELTNLAAVKAINQSLVTTANVTFNSIAATEALFFGKPAIALAPNAAQALCNNKLSDVEHLNCPSLDEVHAFACHLSYCQFTPNELRSGYAWSIVNESN